MFATVCLCVCVCAKPRFPGKRIPPHTRRLSLPSHAASPRPHLKCRLVGPLLVEAVQLRRQRVRGALLLRGHLTAEGLHVLLKGGQGRFAILDDLVRLGQGRDKESQSRSRNEGV